MPYDLVTFGETMIRLSPPNHQRLEQANSLDVHVGGSELNAAVAAARLGVSVSYVTRLTSNPLGDRIRNEARLHGVDTQHIVWTQGDRVGTYYMEYGASPRPNAVHYDRANSAMARIEAGAIPWADIFDNVKLFYTSGITPALSATAADATLEAVQSARESGAKVCIDLNYRARLWTQAEARSVMTRIVELADVLFATEEDTARVFGIEEDTYESVARRLADRFGLEAVAITLRENPSVWRNRWTAIAYETRTDTVHRAPCFDIEVVDRVGSGDSFVGGFLAGLLESGVGLSVKLGVGMSALKQTLPGDLCNASREDVDRALEGGGLRIVR